MSADKYSAKKFEEFCNYVLEKNLMNKETASSRKVASLKILAALDESDRQDLRILDRELAFTRFQNKSGSQYTPSSLGVYRSRFLMALDNFISFQDNPSAFRPNAARLNGKKKEDSQKQKKSTKGIAQPKVAASEHLPLENNFSLENLTLPIPLRPGVIVKIFGLPSDLTADEAKKISTIVTGYAISTSNK